MTNLQVAWTLREIADLLEIKEDNRFKVNAYRRAADSVAALSEELAVREEPLSSIPGVGGNLAAKIHDLLTMGYSPYLENLRREVPPALREVLAIPGLGPKSVRLLHAKLGITSLEELEAAAQERRVRQLPGMGSKTELGILRGIEMLRGLRETLPLGVALPVGQILAADLRLLEGVGRAEVAGEVRRGCELVRRLLLLCAVTTPGSPWKVLARHPQVKEALGSDDDSLRLRTWLGLEVVIRAVPGDDFGTALVLATGSSKHLRLLAAHAAERRFLLSEQGLFDPSGQRVKSPNEEEFYRTLGLSWIPPEIREGGREVELAALGRLPRLVEMGDIKGDLHLHSRWSDGVNTVPELVQAAKERGYRYLAVTDHSQSLAIARGLKPEDLRRQQAEVRSLASAEGDEGLHLLTGMEVDILRQGGLDYPDELLAASDMVLASVHTAFKMSAAEMTQRVESALRNPWVHLLAHPSGRLLGRRPAYDLDLEEVLTLAAETGKALEINASPDRLDLEPTAAARAAAMGIPLAINTDAHDLSNLDNMVYGLTVARRAWLGPGQVLNAWPWEQLVLWLQKRRNGGG